MHEDGRQEIYVRDTSEKGEPVRLLLVDGAIETGIYLRSERRHELYSNYLRQLDIAFQMRPGIERTLLIGGGGFAYPGYYLKKYPDRQIDVIESSRVILNIARESFFLDEILEGAGTDFDKAIYGSPSFDKEARIRIFAEDGLSYLLRCDKQYDMIINDAFEGWRASEHLRGHDGTRLIRSHLTKGGIYAVNVATAGGGIFAFRGRAMKRIMAKHFRYMTSVAAVEGRGKFEEQNYIFFGSDEDLIPE